MNTKILAILTEQGKIFMLPMQTLTKLAVTNVEKLLLLQMSSLQSYSDLGLSQWQAASQVSDLGSWQAYMVEQGKILMNFGEQFAEDVKDVSQLGTEYSVQVHKTMQKGVTAAAYRAVGNFTPEFGCLLRDQAIPDEVMTHRSLVQQNQVYAGTKGVSQKNCRLGFVPAFMDLDSNIVYISCQADGSPAPIHIMDGLPDELVVARDASDRVLAVKGSVISGFVKQGRFYTREQAVQALR